MNKILSYLSLSLTLIFGLVSKLMIWGVFHGPCKKGVQIQILGEGGLILGEENGRKEAACKEWSDKELCVDEEEARRNSGRVMPKSCVLMRHQLC